MVRRTKDDADKTRHQLLDAAEKLFQAKGVSRTSLQDIAAEAGATRGAIYWHFKDKADLFNAMMDRVTLPMEQAFPKPDIQLDTLPDPVGALRSGMREVLALIAGDERVRRVFEVVTLQMEYHSDMVAVKERHLRLRRQYLRLTEQMLGEAARRERRTLPIPAEVASAGLHALLDGIKRGWLLEPDGQDLETTGLQAIDTYLAGLGFKQTGQGPTPAN